MLPWFILSTPKDAVLLWQLEHSLPGMPAGVMVGMWFDGFTTMFV